MYMRKNIGGKHLLVTVIFLLLITGLKYALAHPHILTSNLALRSINSSTQGVFSQIAATKNTGCLAVNSLPDLACTPGVVMPTATKDQICVPGYSGTVRNVTIQEKDAAYAEYGITNHSAREYEVDHLISLELGGSNDIANLWPEAANPVPGFHQKDEFENKLHSEVCSGTISLAEAQKEISTNWLQYYAAQ
jgi:hypothetical protein